MLRHARVLITGGAGFMGSALAQRLLEHGEHPRLLDLAPLPRWASEAHVGYISGDVLDPDRLTAALKGVEVVVHAAFASPHSGMEVIRQVNVGGVRALCDAMVRQDVRRLVLISSTIVLKPPRRHPVWPSAPLNRLDAYRAARLEAEQVVESYADRGLSTAIVRPKTFVGPGRLGAFALAFDSLRRGQPVPVLGSGMNRYQLLDVRDMAAGLASLIDSQASGVFNFGARKFGTVREDLQDLINWAGTGSSLRFVPERLARMVVRGVELLGLAPLAEWHHASAAGTDSIVDVSRAEQELGWQPAYSNLDSLKTNFDWYSSQMEEAGSAPSTHPVPLSHRFMSRLYRAISR